MRFEKKNLLNILSILAEGRELFVPGEVRGMKQFKLWEGEEPMLDGGNTTLPPKDILFPKTEKMYSFKRGDNAEIEEIIEAPQRVIFGLRACDMRSIECMDSVFIKEGYTDSFYARRRSESLIIALSCPGAGANCFCESMGVDPNAAPAADIFLCDCGDSYSAAAQTPKGEEELAKWSEYLHEGEAATGDVHCSLRPAMSEALSESCPGFSITTNSGGRSPHPATTAAPAPSSAPPATALISTTPTWATRAWHSAAGTAACSPTITRTPADTTPAPPRKKNSATAICTSSPTSTTATVWNCAWAADAA